MEADTRTGLGSRRSAQAGCTPRPQLRSRGLLLGSVPCTMSRGTAEKQAGGRGADVRRARGQCPLHDRAPEGGPRRLRGPGASPSSRGGADRNPPTAAGRAATTGTRGRRLASGWRGGSSRPGLPPPSRRRGRSLGRWPRALAAGTLQKGRAHTNTAAPSVPRPRPDTVTWATTRAH